MLFPHTLLPMTQDDRIEDSARRRLRGLRVARGWTIDELARRAHLSAATISRLETGKRRLALDHLVTLARALETTVDDLLAEEGDEDVVIRPTRDAAGGATFWMLTRPDDPSGRSVAKMRLPSAKRAPEPRVHPGREWFYVLSGTVRLVIDGHEHLVATGQAAEFDTMRPHAVVGYGAAAEVLTIFDRHGERAHLHPR
jgi:transcriptional regulator with XRE-family HTH domain